MPNARQPDGEVPGRSSGSPNGSRPLISFGDDGIVVGEVEKGDGAMTGRAWREDVLSVVTERFERRLTEEISRRGLMTIMR